MSEARIKTFKNKARDQAVSGGGCGHGGGWEETTQHTSCHCCVSYILYIGDEKKENRGHRPTS